MPSEYGNPRDRLPVVRAKKKVAPELAPVARPMPDAMLGSAPARHRGRPGLVEPGNIDLKHRPVVRNRDGSISTVRSITIEDNGRQILIPTVVGRRVVSNPEAIAHWRRTGRHLGVFDNAAAAELYAKQLHENQAAMYGPARVLPPVGVRGREADIPVPTRSDHRRRRIREITDKVIHGQLEPLEARAHYQGLGLTEREKKYLFDYSTRASKRAQNKVDRNFENAYGYVVGPNLAKLIPGGAPTSEIDPKWAGVEVAGLLPFGKGARAIRPLSALVRGRRAVEPVAPEIVAGAEKVVGSLGEAKKLRGQQEKLYRAERAKRGGASEQAAQDVGGQAGYRAALGELKGELPKLKFDALKKGLGQDEADTLFSHIQGREDLRPYDKLNAQRALLNAIEGKVPTRSDIRRLTEVFGPDVAKQIKEGVPLGAKAKRVAAELWNVPRSLVASFDVSAPFRQGLVVGARHPKLFFKNFNQMFRAFGSDKAYAAVMDEIASRPTFETMQKAKLSLTDLEHISQREEQFMSNFAERIPVAGRGVRASGRAYTAFLNKTRADVFDYLVDVAGKEGRNVDDPEFLQSLARYINSATGRGHLGALENSAVALNAVMFSPRLMWSRLNLLNPTYYAKLDPFARKEALASMRNLVGAAGAVLFLAKMGGAKVEMDPRNADFAKIRVGNTRIDILGGFQQYVRFAATMASGKKISSVTGEEERLGPGFGETSRKDIVERFLRGKLNPSASLIADSPLGYGVDFAYNPFNWKSAIAQRAIPLGGQSSYELYKETGNVPAAVGSYGVNAFGFGVSTYGGPRKPKRRQASRGGSGSLAPIPRGTGPAAQGGLAPIPRP